ncbi:signal transduction histidine kinase [Clostridium pascui]|uniref:HAMP domain-containing sensor histidine kinase n=1 Tax=Clostridium pascui TaxID=46609 RepID=UPI00195652CF|nr:HAMP domain-containing sensor histidine kinase [Clostridium pascui]MBM7872216.1 signal transduction histidine kinase [Clostridium pascui]
MDTRWKKHSHSLTTKIILFIVVITSFTGVITTLMNLIRTNNYDFGIIFQDSYYQSSKFIEDSRNTIDALTKITVKYKNQENVLKGGSITEDRIQSEVNNRNLYWEFESKSKLFNPNLSYEENYNKFKEVYTDKISEIKNDLIKEELRDYNQYVQRVKDLKGVIYYASDGTNVLTNSTNTSREYFESFPSYVIYDKDQEKVYPKEILNNRRYYWISSDVNELHQQDSVIYVGFTNEYLNPAIEEWKQSRLIINDSLYKISGFLLGLLVSFICLVVVTGRKFFGDKEVHLNSFDKLYNDINLIVCFLLIGLWIVPVVSLGIDFHNLNNIVIALTAFIASLGLIFVLTLIKHIKNRTFIKHTLVYKIFYKVFKFAKEVYNNGSFAVKVALITIGYPILVALTFFMFPITIGAAVWIAFKKTKEFQLIKDGVERVKNGELNHKINLESKGELGKLASNINSITEGLNKAVENEVKSERLKTELITNVSHDIRTPLTSIITYVDLLKNETDKSKSDEYIEILEQKSQRLKVLTEDLFEASKASSGSIPVEYEKIDVTSLITQGLGELNDKIEELGLEFKLNHPKDKVYIKADGKLFWRVIENLLSNIFKYALTGSRVYIDIEDLESQARIIIKNISAYELNISANELMERFKRGDESRSSQGSGLGLSIAKSFIDIQNGKFHIEIDGDLFKAVIQMPKF